MIVDSSALLAVIFNEPEAQKFARLLEQQPASIAAPTLLEASMVVDRAPRRELGRSLDKLVAAVELRIEPFTDVHATIAREAWSLFGRGTDHPAKLNFGDCISYALAYATGEPLLFKGDDFVHTDIKPAVELED